MQLYLEQLAEHIKNIPGKTAIADREGERETSYETLWSLSDRIAAVLIKRGVRKGTFVSILLPREMEYIAASLGILKAGGVIVPLSFSYPKERIDFINDQCGAGAVIDEKFLAELPKETGRLCLPKIEGTDRALAVYTSGSTGTPKGIVHSHLSLASAARRSAQVFVTAEDVYLSNLPFHFVAIVVDVFMGLYAGGSVHINSEEGRKDIRRIEDYIADHRITATLISPQMMKLFKNKGDSLRTVLCGSERVSGVYGDGYQIYNIYGSSETTPAATFFKVDREYDNTPIGKPFPDMGIYVLREDGSQAGPEETGEICISGYLAEGYLGLPEKTAETFTESPFAKGETDRVLYHSGDLGYLQKDGNLVYVNRKDWMVKINGQRVETGEIEAIISGLSYVKTAVVKGFENEYGQTWLCGYFQLEDGDGPENPAAAIKGELKKKLADYMIPQFLIRMDAFPLNQNGKLDRLALKAPDASAFKAEYQAPQSEEEAAICRGFEAVLAIDRIGRKDDFFTIGGDSIKAVRLQEFCQDLFLTSAQIFEGKTPAGIAALLDGQKADPYAGCDSPRDFYPLTDSQLGVFLECMQSPESVMYNIPFCLTAPGDTDVPRLQRALETVVRHYPALLVGTGQKDGEYGMIPLPDREVVIPVREIAGSEMEKIKACFVRAFDLEKGPLFRIELYKTEQQVYLLADFHHIISDGASVAEFFRQTARAYEGKPLEKEVISQFTLANYEKTLKEKDVYKEAKAYFEKYLAGNEVDVSPVFDRPEDPQQSVRPGKRHYVNLAGKLSSEELERFSRQAGVTENTVFLGAYAYALAKYTGQSEALLATVNNGRHDPRMNHTLGMLVRTLPVYLSIDEEETVAGFLENLQSRFFETMSHDCCSFGELAREYGVTSDLLFVYQAQTLNSVTLDGAEVPMEALETGNSLANIALHVFRKKGSYDMFFEYRSDVYERKTIETLGNLLVRVVRGFLEYGRLKELPLVSPQEVGMLESFYGETISYDRSKTIVDLFREQAGRVPEKTAVIYKEKRIAYREVDELSERIAAYVSGQGIGREQVVAVLIPRCEYMAIASLGVMKAGAAYQPLDPTYPMDRLAFMMEDAGVELLIADESLLSLVPQFKGKVLLTKDIPSLPPAEEPGKTDPAPEDLFILLYTSGTTGTPKGCMLTQANITAFCHWYQSFYEMDDESVVGAYASYGFDACMMDLYPALTFGAAVLIIPEELRLELVSLNQYLENKKATHIFMTTQVGRQFAAEMENHSLRHLSTGGETLVPVRVEADYAFYNVYGPTECTIYTTAFEVDKTAAYENVPIGRPLGNLELYILDKQQRRVPPGALGELCVAGYQVSRGYLGRPEQTEKVFTSNPFTNREGFERMYHTGDIVRFLPDGNIQFIGRRDGQVKIRGFRIELTEVEGIIRQYPGIKDATVMAFDAPAGGKAIAAYVVSDETVDIQRLNAFIQEEKPPYMVPAVTMQIDEIPLNQNMKVNRRALPDPLSQTPKTGGDDSRPLTLLEQELKELVGGIVGHEEFSVGTELTRAGITSLSAIKLAAAIEKEYGLTLEVKAMMKQCTILSIEDEIYKSLRSGALPAARKEQRALRDTYPLTQAQMGVYYDAVRRPEDTGYNIPAVFRFPGKLTAETLADAARTVVKAHPYLSARLCYRDGALVQVPFEEEPVVEVHSMSEDTFGDYRDRFVKPFELENSRLYRLAAVETEVGLYLLTDFHHIIFDGGSLDVFLRQVAAACEGAEAEKEDYSYFDYAADRQAAEDSDAYRQAGEFFADLLKNCEGASQLTPDLAGEETAGRKAEQAVFVDGEKLDAFCRAGGVTPAHLFLAGVFYTLARFLHTEEVYLSTISSGRSDLKVRQSLGMFVNTLPLAASLGQGKTAIDFIRESADLMMDAVSHEGYPFSKIAQDYDFAPQIMYACQLGVLEKVELLGSQVEMESLESDTPKFKISIHIEEREGRPAVCVQYNDALYSGELAALLAGSIALCVERMMAGLECPLRSISLVTEPQKKVLEGFCRRAAAEPEEELFHKAFEKQAALHKNKTALIASEGSYTYGELDERMNRVAAALAARGFGPGQSAAVLLPRTGALIIAMYGVMKAGGAYIPCDPDYPAERIRQITEDSSASLVITTTDRLADYEQAVDMEELLAYEGAPAPLAAVTGHDLAYMIYTSGSTGKPKGVMLEHRGIVNYTRNHEANPHVRACAEEGHVMVSVTTVSFDMSLKETAVALLNGLTLVLADEDCANHPLHLAQLMEKTGGDIFNATPSRMLQYMESAEFCRVLAGCKVVMSGGEQYSLKLLEKLKKVTKARIFNTYGPTEITVSSNAKELTFADRITIGPPLLNYTEFIADSDGNPLPPGVTGELYIGGMGVARGYHNLPEMTEERFITAFGQRVYKSGDYARWTPEGDVVILGRTDNQIKLRGLRIELEEIESCIGGYPGVKNAVTVIREINGTEHLCAYFTAEKAVEVSQLKAFLQEKLTKYMVPTGYCQLETLPMTPNGKIDRKALPEPKLAEAGEYTAPMGEEERVFCQIFADVLKLDKVGANDDFFDLGGTSLRVTSVIIAATEAGFDITYGDVFSHTTPRRLAAMFRTDAGDSASELEDLSDYDYTNVGRVLAENSLDSFVCGQRLPLGNVLLTGATGFLGIHILREFLESESGRVYCILRKGNYDSLEKRLSTMLFYYFETTYEELFGDRILLVEGNVTDPGVFQRLEGEDIQTVINCAANVKHFSKGTDIEDVNVGGVLNAIDYCKRTGSRIVHISTTSVSGFSVGDVPPSNTVMSEQMLYFGQALDTKYGHSKFLAERAVLEAAAAGLSAKIMRVGNLSARDTDGEFQMNFATNSFVGRLKSYELIGKFPYSMMDMTAEMAPIDSTARAILTLAKTPKAYCLFHPYNNHSIYLGDIICAMKSCGVEIELAEEADYLAALETAQKDPDKAAVLSSMIAYENMGHGKKTVSIARTNDYTMQVLYRMGYQWPTTSKEYVGRFVEAMEGLGFFAGA